MMRIVYGNVVLECENGITLSIEGDTKDGFAWEAWLSARKKQGGRAPTYGIAYRKAMRASAQLHRKEGKK